MDSVLSNRAVSNTQRNVSLWRPSSLLHLPKLNRNSSSTLKSESKIKKKVKVFDRGWDTIVSIILVEAKCLPPVPDDGVSHNLYCKFRLGSESRRSKSVPSSQHPIWREKMQLHLYQNYTLNISLRDKGKMKNSMGSCILDLSTYEKERTHEIWLQLDGGYGVIHISVTMCAIRSPEATSNCLVDLRDYVKKYEILSNPCEWSVVGTLHVNVIGAKGLTSKPNAYCTLEIDNEKVETNRAGASCEPRWNKSYVFKVYDVTSTLDLKIYDSSLTNALLNESIGRVSIPLLRISNDVIRWYALKDRNKRSNAKGNCPRVQLQMSLVWNPVKATVKLFQSKEVKYIKKSPKLDLPLIYSNVKYVADLLDLLAVMNEHYKRLFEWDDREYSFCILLGWLAFCYYITLWNLPLLLLLPFIYHWFIDRHRDNVAIVQDYANDDENKEAKIGMIQELHKIMVTIIDSIDFIVSYKERIINLVTFKEPFLGIVSMVLLVAASVGLYFIPFNYLLMGLGIYKFGRKYLNPDRVLNNDLIDFLSRVPDNRILKDWKELGVPEPNQEYQQRSSKIVRSISTP